MLAAASPRALPAQITCPQCEQPLRATYVHMEADRPPAVTYACVTPPCSGSEFLVYAL